MNTPVITPAGEVAYLPDDETVALAAAMREAMRANLSPGWHQLYEVPTTEDC